METKGFLQFEIIINVLVSSFRFIGIPMLYAYRHDKYFISFSAGTVFRRQNRCQIMTYKDGPRSERVKAQRQV